MAVHFETEDPAGLLAAFDKAITQTEASGKITTWSSHKGPWYGHLGQQYGGKAYLQPSTTGTRLTFYIAPASQAIINQDVFAYYQGHLIETFIRHFSAKFGAASATALKTGSDRFQ